ncbi:MAG TPA: ABC transporter permease [Solirubrobacteraceae bacterium]|nr:ABC transporter permease [Solirubrobacteraceae bacterium]
MIAFILKRIGLALITLWLLSVIVFLLGQILPGDPGRAILGPLAAKSAVTALDQQLGVNKPVLTEYWNWISGFPGKSYTYQSAIGPILLSALGRSLKLAILAFIIVVPLGIFAGVVAALNVGNPIDKIISVGGGSSTVIPEFVSGIILLVVFGVALKWLPVTATAPPGSSFLTSIKYLIMPAIPLVIVLFGYIARMARAGTVEALDSDYARTATLKGLPRRVMIRRHVLRNSLLPTITVVATQTGYLIGGLVVVETIFRYQGIGQLTYQAAQQKDFPMLEACVLTIGAVYMVVTIGADVLFSMLNPRIRLKAAE